MQASEPESREPSMDQLASARADIDEISEWVAVDYCQAARKTLSFLPSQVGLAQAACTPLLTGQPALECILDS